MIRFVNITGQIIEDEFCFAWYDTVRDRFIEVNNNQVWDSWGEFAEDFVLNKGDNSTFDLSRFFSLFPPHLRYKGSI